MTGSGVMARIHFSNSQPSLRANGRANARPLTGSATKQSILPLRGEMDLLRFARNDVKFQM